MAAEREARSGASREGDDRRQRGTRAKSLLREQIKRVRVSKYLLPVITNVAHFVHLLPASQDDHHQGYGGLFTHSLEVAFEAANLAKNTIFDRVSPPKEIQWNRRRWILICVLAGLVHDIGKPYTDLEVTTGPDEGGKSWKKSLPLLDWLRQEHIT